MYKIISYQITDYVPAWPGSPQTAIKKHNEIAKGDAANTSVISIYNHIGTHYDAPNHFIADGLKICDLPKSRFIFERPLVLDIPKSFCEKITKNDLFPFADKIKDCDLLMLRTGFSVFRVEAPQRYEKEGPAIGSDAAEYLVLNFPLLSAVAVDFVSIGSYSDAADGERTHRALLGGKNGHFICAIEDVNMSVIEKNKLKKVFALPLFVQEADSAPVTMLAEERE
jgi:kynurenine formamidase